MMIQLFIIIGKIIGAIFPIEFMKRIKTVADYVRTGYYGSSLKLLGKRTIIRKGVNIVGGSNISIGNECVILSHTVLSTWRGCDTLIPQLVIKDGVHMGEGCHLTATNLIIIGEETLLGKHITITDNSHGEIVAAEADEAPYCRSIKSKGPVIIGKRVWIGDKVTVLPNVKVGDAAIIGANSVVTKDIPTRCVVAGNPAKIIKKY